MGTQLAEVHQGRASGDRCLGSQRFAGQDEVMADALFESVKKQKANGKSWWWQCMSVVPVTESDADPIL